MALKCRGEILPILTCGRDQRRVEDLLSFYVIWVLCFLAENSVIEKLEAVLESCHTSHSYPVAFPFAKMFSLVHPHQELESTLLESFLVLFYGIPNHVELRVHLLGKEQSSQNFSDKFRWNIQPGPTEQFHAVASVPRVPFPITYSVLFSFADLSPSDLESKRVKLKLTADLGPCDLKLAFSPGNLSSGAHTQNLEARTRIRCRVSLLPKHTRRALRDRALSMIDVVFSR